MQRFAIFKVVYKVNNRQIGSTAKVHRKLLQVKLLLATRATPAAQRRSEVVDIPGGAGTGVPVNLTFYSPNLHVLWN